jgi:hypothetical protein
MVELMVSLVVLIPIMGAAFSLFSVAVKQHNNEQSGVEVNQEGRSALELMSLEIAQAGSHRDFNTTAAGAITAQVNAQAVSVASSTGFTVGDYVDIDVGANNEKVQLTAIGNNTISGIFRIAHANGAVVRLFSQPFLAGVVPPAGLGANSSATTTSLKFFGDINADGNINYVEYVYDGNNSQITRSMTPITAANKSAALPFISNIKSNSANFKLYTDARGVVTSVSLALTVRNPGTMASLHEETPLATRVDVPSAVAASALLNEIQVYGGLNQFPATPAKVTTWANQ